METTTANRRTVPMATEINTTLETPGDFEVPSTEKRGRTALSYNLRTDFIQWFAYYLHRQKSIMNKQ